MSITRAASLFGRMIDASRGDLCGARSARALGVKVERPQRREDERP